MIVKTTLTMPSELAKKVKTYCKENGMTVSGLVKVLLVKHLEENDK